MKSSICFLFKAARSTHVQYLLLDNRGDPKRKQVEFEVDLDSLGVLGMPSDKLGVAHQDHVSFHLTSTG